jgi:putative aldouronate transport system permease protein
MKDLSYAAIPARMALALRVAAKKIQKEKLLYLMLIPGLLYYLVFKYLPMYGILVAFQDFSIFKGFSGSPWVGLKHFIHFFVETPDSWKLIRNTLMINVYELAFAFPAPIVLAILFNELKNKLFKRFAQTVSYLPHFISVVVVCGMVVNFLSPSTGILNHFLVKIGLLEQSFMFMGDPDWFRAIFVSMNIWHGIGWGTILYLAAIAGVDPSLYEAAKMDGANRFQQIRHITLVGMVPIIIVLLILNLGNIMEVGFQKVILLYNPLNYETADVINSYVYRVGLNEGKYSFAAAIGLFQNVIGFILVVTANRLARKYSDSSLW